MTLFDHDTRHRLVSALFDQNELVLIPAEPSGLEALPAVTLGPHTDIDLGEYLAMMRGLGVRGLYLVEAGAHLDAVTTGEPGPQRLVVHALAGGVVHTFTSQAD